MEKHFMQTSIYSTIPSPASLHRYIEQFIDVRPRLCTLHRWSHYNGYGVHLTCNENWRGLCINEVEPNSPAESAGLRRGDLVFALNGQPINNDEFFKILSLIQHELVQDQLRFLVLDRQSAQLVQQYQMNISENDPNCIRKETAQVIQSNAHALYDLPRKESKVIGHDIYPQEELRLCSITLSPSKEPIGIYLRTDTEYSHIITYVRPNSLAARAGIRQDDCILSLNGALLLNIPFEDVLYFLAKSRREAKLDFLIAQKTYLLQLSQEQLMSKIHEQITKTSEPASRRRASTLPTKETPERIYQQVKFEQDDRLSVQTYACSNLISRKKNRGKFFDTIGPITAFGSAWSLPSEQSIAYPSIRADLYGRKSGLYELPRYSLVKNTVKPVQTGIFISSPKSPTHRLPDVSVSENEQQSTHSSPLRKRLTSFLTKTKSSIHSPSPILKRKLTIRSIFSTGFGTPGQSSPALSVREKDNCQLFLSNLHLATISVSELPNCGYEIHQIQLMRPVGKTPIGFKLTKQADSLQYTMTAIVQGSSADQAGVKVDDWLIQIEDKDIRLTDLHDVLKEIRRLFLEKDSISMIVARKKAMSLKLEEQASSNIDFLSSVGLSNPTRTEDLQSSTTNQPSTSRATDPNPDKLHSITLRDSSGLYLNSVRLDDTNQTQVHYVNSIQPISLAYRAGLRNYDRILRVNDVDVAKTSLEDLRLMIKRSKPIYLLVIRDPEYFKTIENIKQNQTRKTLASTTYETVVYQQSKDLNYVLFHDDQGPLYIKYCVIKKEPSFDALGFRLNYENNVHIVRNIEKSFPGYRCGLRDNDIILFLNKRNVQQMTHEELKIRLRPLVLSNTTFDFIVLNALDLPRYKDYQNKRFIDWFQLFSKIQKNSTNQNTTEAQPSSTNETSNPTPHESPANPQLSGARICLLEPVADRSLGFTVEGGRPPPYRISKVQPDSSAEKAGLKVNDVILSINGTSVLESAYDDTLQLIRSASQQKHIQFVVNQSAKKQKYHSDRDSDLSFSSSEEDSGDDKHYTRDPREDEAAHRGANAVHLYQIEYDTPPDRPENSRTYTPLLTTFLPTPTLSKAYPTNTESTATNDANQLNSSYDIIREPRRCVLKLDPDKGLGFVLSAMGDYDHTITAIDKGSIADIAGLHVNDELVEIDGINVRNIKYEKVIEMLIQAMQTKETIEIHVVNSQNVSNGNNNNNNNNNSSISSIQATPILNADSSDEKAQIRSSKQSACNTSHPDLYKPPAYLHSPMDYMRSESVPGISTGLTASPNDFRQRKPLTISSERETFYNMSETSKKDAPVARLCRIQKFPSSPFYGFFLCSDRRKPGSRVFVSNIKKHSSAAICGLRDGDHIVEVNGTNIQNLTYDTILNIIKMHMDHEDLELLVLDKKSLQWYEKRNFPITLQTLPTVVHIEPIINDLNTKF